MRLSMARGFDSGEEIGARIAKLRAGADLKVEELASRVGVTADALQKLMRGESTSQYLKLIKIARALKTTPDTILGFNEPGFLKAVLEACFDSLGLTAEQTEALAETVLQVLEAQPIPELDPVSQARAQAPVLLQSLLRSKSGK